MAKPPLKLIERLVPLCTVYLLTSLTIVPQVLDRGCRCVEIDVWNGDELASHDAGDESSQLASLSLDNVSKRRPERIEPRVLHGHTATKECSFREVVQTIREDAFSKT